MDEKEQAKRRLLALVREGLASPIEPEDPTFWDKRREALRRAIAQRRKSERVKLSS